MGIEKNAHIHGCFIIRASVESMKRRTVLQ